MLALRMEKKAGGVGGCGNRAETELHGEGGGKPGNWKRNRSAAFHWVLFSGMSRKG
jgi:hypothetical protein